MGNNKYTELDKLFQSKLMDEKVGNGEWNNPTDDSFFSAISSIKPEEEIEEQKKIVWWPYLFLLLIPVSLLVLWNTSKVNDLQSEIDEINQTQIEQITSEQSPVTSKPFLNSTAQEVPTASIEVKEQSLIENDVKKSVPKNNTNSIIDNKVSKSFNSKPSDSFTSVNNYTGGNGKIVTNDGVGSGVKNNLFDVPVLVDSKESKTNQMDALAFIDGFGGVSSIDQDDFSYASPEFSSFEDADKYGIQKGLAAYAFLDVNLNSLRMSGLQPSSFSLTGYDKSYLGYEVGVGVLQSFNERFAINYSASYRHVMNKSNYTNDFMFEEDKVVTNVDGQLVYQLFSELQTPTGAYISNQDLAIDDTGMEDKEMMDQQADIKLVFDFVSIGLKPRFSLYKKNQLNVFAEGGVNLNYLIHYCQSIDMQFSYHDKMMMENEVDDFSMNKLNRFSIASSLSLGLEYNIGEHFFSSFKLGASRSLNSIKQLGVNNDNTQTYIDNLGVALSAGYKF